MFNALLVLAHIDLIRGLVWVGLLGSLATFYGFFAGAAPSPWRDFSSMAASRVIAFSETCNFADYQGDGIAWKSIPLTMFVTQRGLLYAIPAGLLLLLHWQRNILP